MALFGSARDANLIRSVQKSTQSSEGTKPESQAREPKQDLNNITQKYLAVFENQHF